MSAENMRTDQWRPLVEADMTDDEPIEDEPGPEDEPEPEDE